MATSRECKANFLWRWSIGLLCATVSSCDDEARRFAEATDRCNAQDTVADSLRLNIDGVSKRDEFTKVSITAKNKRGRLHWTRPITLTTHETYGGTFVVEPAQRIAVDRRVNYTFNFGARRLLLDSFLIRPEPKGGGIGHTVYPTCALDSVRINGRWHRVDFSMAEVTVDVAALSQE